MIKVKKIHFIFYIFTFFIFMISNTFSFVGISSCQNITSAGYYQVVNDLYINSSTCISIQTTGVEIYCDNFKIVGNKTTNTYGIYLNSTSNNVISNCIIEDFYIGLLIEDSGYNNISNMILKNNSGWNVRFLDNSDKNNLKNTTSSYSSYCLGFDGWNPEFNNIVDFYASNCGEGIVLWGGASNNISNFKIINTSNWGLEISSNDNIVKSGYIENAKVGIDIYGGGGAKRNTISNIEVVNSSQYDMYIRSWTSTDTNQWPGDNVFSNLKFKNSSLIYANIDFSITNNTFTDFYFTDEDSSSVCFPPGLNYACVNNLAYIDTSTNIFPFFENYLLLFTLIIFYLFFN